MTIVYSARWVLPIINPAIRDGAVAIEASEIVGVGPSAEVTSQFPNSPIEDFGEAAIVPGFINAHSHLELTVMRGFLEGEEHDFFAWLRKLTVARMAMSPGDLTVSATWGAIEAARAGVTCLGDSSSAGAQTMKALNEVGLRGTVFQESFGPDPKLCVDNVAKLRTQIDEMRDYESGLVRAGVSPHAPYTVSAPQLESISRMAIDDRLPLMMHAAESEAENLLLREGRGPFAEGLKKRAIDWQAPGISTIAYLKRHGVMETKPLLAHCINVDEAGLEIIKQSDARIAHCPKSNAKLGHGCAPLAEFISRGIKTGLGSDSVASNNTCDILEEARFATLVSRLDWSRSPTVREGVESDRGTSPTVREGSSLLCDYEARALPHGRANSPLSAEQALFAATLGGARALGLDDQVGALTEGMQADITIIGLAGAHQQPVHNPTDALVFSSSGRDVLLTMVAGRVIYSDRRMNRTSESELLLRLESIRSKLSAVA